MSIHMVRLPLYGTCLVFGVLIGMLYINLSLKKEIKANKNVLLYNMMYIPFALVFGYIYTSLIYFGNEAGFSSYGGLIGVVLSALIFEYIIPLDGKLIKHAIISLPLVYGLTKLGCFFGGCCSGIPYEGIFNIVYYWDLNIKQFPIQLVESIVSLIMFFIVLRFKDKKYINYIVLLLVFSVKFLLDFLRYDHVKVLITRNQIFSIVAFIFVVILLIINRCKKIKNG